MVINQIKTFAAGGNALDRLNLPTIASIFLWGEGGSKSLALNIQLNNSVGAAKSCKVFHL